MIRSYFKLLIVYVGSIHTKFQVEYGLLSFDEEFGRFGRQKGACWSPSDALSLTRVLSLGVDGAVIDRFYFVCSKKRLNPSPMI